MKIELDRGQIADICYALALASYEAIMNQCPITSGIYDELRQKLHKMEELEIKSELNSRYGGYVDTDSIKQRERLYCKNCVHCESNSDETRCLLKNRCVSINAHAEECSNYTEIQKP